ncbi:hypothetical protein, partial [Pseudomonas aeruginosa]|uniref:hypothetical protein n=1 Tax=Pseudomonas aeruginosa TaxID=287 RepID=UPI001968BAF4
AEFGIRHRGSTVPERSGVALSFCRRHVLSGNSSREHAENIRAAGQIAGVRMLRPRRSMYELFEDLKISSFGRPAPKEGQ